MEFLIRIICEFENNKSRTFEYMMNIFAINENDARFIAKKFIDIMKINDIVKDIFIEPYEKNKTVH